MSTVRNELFSCSRRADSNNKAIASAHLESLTASLGSTQLVDCLRSAFAIAPQSRRFRFVNLFLLSDGHITGVQSQLLQELRQINADSKERFGGVNKVRMFTFGVG